MIGKAVLGLMYSMFCIGVFMLFKYFPDNVRLKRGRTGVRELIISVQRKTKEQITRSRFYVNIKEDAVDRAIYEDLSFLMNMITANKAMINSDAVISSLSEKNGVLKRTYAKMLSLMRTGRVEEAELCMRNETGTEMGREFAALLTGWEYIPPKQLEEIIISYRRSIKEICLTRQKKKDEIISDLIYFPATMNVFLIFINFVYISFFMQQKEMFQMLF